MVLNPIFTFWATRETARKINSGKTIDKPTQSAAGVIQNLEFFIPLKDLIDVFPAMILSFSKKENFFHLKFQ